MTPIQKTKALLKTAYYGLQHALISPTARLCPVCGFNVRRFASFGSPQRKEARCQNCGALERHRFAWLLLQEQTDLFDGRPKQVLHVAPEHCFEERLESELGSGYITADLLRTDVKVRMDITEIQYENDRFDTILCSHVLEHVPGDRQAMKELFRVLKPGGWAFLDVPIAALATYEDPSIVDPAERLKAFGQEDHVRKYGPDYAHRLEESGFRVKIVKVADLADVDSARRFGILPMNRLTFICRKD